MQPLRTIRRIPLATVPTPLHSVPRLAAHAGLEKLYIKRDDLTGFAGGGTKVRKLEYDFAEIISKQHDAVVTAGGMQSNLVRLAAAVAARYGIPMKAVLGGPVPAKKEGNLLLNDLFGAEIRLLPDDDDNQHMTAMAEAWVEELRQQGADPYLLPIGGSTPLGSLGCIAVMDELAAELGDQSPVQIVLPVGSCGTFAGLLFGARLAMPNARIIGISISRTAAAIRTRTEELFHGCNALLGTGHALTAADVECYDTFHDVYGVPTPAAQEAQTDAARMEGLLLDPVYTAKAMSGLLALARQGVLAKELPTIFLHTGGTPILFTSGA
ncbi:MAG: pyridoxal-phosphate dependent enzyme [Bacteroidetes bacterium]|nr:pyridoxal-phosphate dependent enzyme [Bacteroidota bacterium]